MRGVRVLQDLTEGATTQLAKASRSNYRNHDLMYVSKAGKSSLHWDTHLRRLRSSIPRRQAPHHIPRQRNDRCLLASQTSSNSLFVQHGRHFSSSPCSLKKGSKAAREEKQAASSSSKDTASDDPFDFSPLEADIAAAVERLKNDLSKLRAGGRFNPEVLENLRVQPDKSSTQTVKLSDVAQVIPKGRTVQIMVGEKDHVKPVSAAIQSSSLSLTPQPDPTGANPLLLVINIPPPTADSRRAAVAEATKAGDKAGTSVRDARGKQQKKLRAMQLAKSARPDDLKKAGVQMEKVVEKGAAEVKKVLDNAKRVLESG